jgi:hypothetical protein
MLISKGVSEGEVITLKLTSGEELVARLVEEGHDFYKLSKPSVIGMSPKGPALMPYLFTVSPDKDIKLGKSAVAVVAASDKEFADQYMQGTTGIALA